MTYISDKQTEMLNRAKQEIARVGNVIVDREALGICCDELYCWMSKVSAGIRTLENTHQLTNAQVEKILNCMDGAGNGISGVNALSDITQDSYYTELQSPTTPTYYSVDFDAVDDILETASVHSEHANLQSMSVSCWLRTQDSVECVMGQYKDAVDQRKWQLFVNSGFSLTWYFDIYENATTYKRYIFPDTYTIKDNTWHHFCATYDLSSDTLKIYVDAVDVTANKDGASRDDAMTAVEIPTAKGLSIGASYNSSGNAANHIRANICEVCLTDFALSASEVTELYNGGDVLPDPAGSVDASDRLSFWKDVVSYYRLGNYSLDSINGSLGSDPNNRLYDIKSGLNLTPESSMVAADIEADAPSS